MKNNNISMRKTLSFASLMMGVAVVSGLYFYGHSHTKKYVSGIKAHAEEHDKDAGAQGMINYFFNARKNNSTGQMDYQAMAAANAEANKMMRSANNARTEAGLSMTWEPMGPSNIGGRTRAILVDNLDHSGNTLFAAAVSGGIWKSTNAGGSWDSVPGNDTLSSMEACDIAQDKNGVLYVGTGEGFSVMGYPVGEGFSCGMIGGGIFKSTDDGASWHVLSSTVPPTNNWTSTWSYVNRIAIDPNNPNYIYAATNKGLQASQDGGNTWATVKNSKNNAALNGTALDVKISPDGSILVASIGGIGYYAYPSGPVTAVTPIPSSTNGGNGTLPASGLRLEFAISPTNPDYVYVSVIRNGLFGPGASKGTGIYMTMNSRTNGGYWYNIGPGGSKTFNPYSSGGSQDQADYDNAVGVSPANPGQVFVAGTVLWMWQQRYTGDTVGGWVEKTSYFGFPYVHPDMHAITFSPTNSNIMYDGNDGGIYKSTDNGKSWLPINRNYNATQFVALAFAPYVSAPYPGYTVGEGVMGGTQDNGTPYISGREYHYFDAVDISGGDGGKSAMSQINPNVFFVTTDNDALLRGANLSSLGSEASLYTNTIGDSSGANIDSIVALGGGCFYNQIALYENGNDTNTLDSMLWIADTSYSTGTTVYPISLNGNVPFPYKLKQNVNAGDTVKVKNVVVSKIAVGLSESTGVWMTMQAINVSVTPIWMPIGGPLSKPDPFTGGAAIHALAWSPDGDALFVGGEDGKFYRLSNLDSVVDDQYVTGALWAAKHGGGTFINPSCRVKCTHIMDFSNRDILSISVDPKNGNNVMVTLGNYSNSVYVYYSTNALSATPTFTPRQGNLPAMPVYSCVLDVLNSGQPNSALVGTERGIYSTTNINVASPTWVYTNTGMANTLVMALGQQTLPPWNCNNAYNVYAGTHGRGAFVSNSFFEPLAVQPVKGDVQQQISLNIYPNPMTTQGTLAFDLPKNGNVTVKVYDLTGRMVESIPMNNQAQGHHQVSLNTENYSTGTYIATVSGNGFMKSARFVVVK